jgi:ubiquinol-cytochrome c reductase cytochrome c subunit
MRTLLVTMLAALVLAAGAGASRGERLFGQYCAKCHDVTSKAPSLRGVGAIAADFYLSTGYMPLSKVGVQPRRSRHVLSDGQISDLVAYVASLGNGPAIPTPHPSQGNVAEGMHLFGDHCAGCHQIAAEGGYVTGGLPPPLEDDNDVQIAEAVRIGPWVMPRFSKRAISDKQLDSIITYVDYAKHPDDRGGWAIGHLGPIPEGLVSWLIAAVLLVAFCMVLGKRLKTE